MALSDSLKMFAVPYKTISNENIEQTISIISNITVEHDIDTVIVGYPTFYDGTPSDQTKQVLRFIKTLERRIAVTIIPYDERYSSKEAQDIIKSKRRRKTSLRHKGSGKSEVDRVAASIILQNYLDSTN